MIELRRLSLCMIVKNEEDCIGRCLESVKDVVDEIIIVDTGSTDRTIEICNSYGVDVVHYPWNDNFADARNYGIERATGDWILWLDADEEVDKTERYKLRDSLYQDDYDLLFIHLVNYYGSEVDPDKVYNVEHSRLFRREKGFRFANKIHEAINVNEILKTEEELARIGRVPLKVYHYGYLNRAVDEKKKYERNITMLKRELDDDNHSPWIHYHIGSEYYRINEYEKAFEHVNKSIVEFILAGYTPPSMLYKLKYSILISLGSFEGAWPGIEKAVALYPDYVDLQFYRGVILYYKGMVQEALKAFDHCIELGEDNLKYLVLKGLGSFQAWYYKGLCLETLGEIEEAINAYQTSLSQCDTLDTAREALNKLLDKEVK